MQKRLVRVGAALAVIGFIFLGIAQMKVTHYEDIAMQESVRSMSVFKLSGNGYTTLQMPGAHEAEDWRGRRTFATFILLAGLGVAGVGIAGPKRLPQVYDRMPKFVGPRDHDDASL